MGVLLPIQEARAIRGEEKMNLWAAQWHSKNKLDGEVKHICYENCLPALFRTRKECRAWIKETYGYIAGRPDLQDEPHGWRMPQAIKVIILPEVRGKSTTHKDKESPES